MTDNKKVSGSDEMDKMTDHASADFSRQKLASFWYITAIKWERVPVGLEFRLYIQHEYLYLQFKFCQTWKWLPIVVSVGGDEHSSKEGTTTRALVEDCCTVPESSRIVLINKCEIQI